MVNSDTLWITGGSDSESIHCLASTEFIQYEAGDWLPSFSGPDLPVALCGHQIVSFNSNFGYVSMIIGGWQSDLNEASELTYFFFQENQTWIEGPSLNQARWGHAATVVTDPVTREELVIVTGGQTTSSSSDFLDTTEILFDGLWASGT